MLVDQEYLASKVDFILNGVAVDVGVGIHDQEEGLTQVQADTTGWLAGWGISVSRICSNGTLRIEVTDTRRSRSTGGIHVRNTGNAVATGGGSANTGVIIGSKFKGANTGVVLDGGRSTDTTQEPSGDFTEVTGNKVLQRVTKPRVRIAVKGPRGLQYRITP